MLAVFAYLTGTGGQAQWWKFATFKEIQTINMNTPQNVTITFDGVTAALPFDGAFALKERLYVGIVTVAYQHFIKDLNPINIISE